MSVPAQSSEAQGSLFGSGLGGVQATTSDAVLIDAYARVGGTLDDLPYSSEFETLFASLPESTASGGRAAVLHRLQNLRKAGRLPRLGKGATPAIKVRPEEEEMLTQLVLEHVPSLGKRDGLLYSPAFDTIVQQFVARTGRPMTPHDVWRLLAKIAK